MEYYITMKNEGAPQVYENKRVNNFSIRKMHFIKIDTPFMSLSSYAMVILDYDIKYKEIQKTIPCL